MVPSLRLVKTRRAILLGLSSLGFSVTKTCMWSSAWTFFPRFSRVETGFDV